MKIVGVAACTAGIAHTYIAKEKLELAARKRGHQVKVETQGTIGVENKLTTEEINEADVVIIAADIQISGKDRFKNKKVVEVNTANVVRSANSLLELIEKNLAK